MARLIGMTTDEVQASRIEIARNFAVAHQAYVVLKGHRTLIATPAEKVPGHAIGGADRPSAVGWRHRRRGAR